MFSSIRARATACPWTASSSFSVLISIFTILLALASILDCICDTVHTMAAACITSASISDTGTDLLKCQLLFSVVISYTIGLASLIAATSSCQAAKPFSVINSIWEEVAPYAAILASNHAGLSVSSTFSTVVSEYAS